MHAATLRFATFSRAVTTSAPRLAPSFKNRRMIRAARRAVPTRSASIAFRKYYDRFLTHRQKILYTQALARLR